MIAARAPDVRDTAVKRMPRKNVSSNKGAAITRASQNSQTGSAVA